ncbi:hypothetical protein D3C73_1635270 [compost metagenome]
MDNHINAVFLENLIQKILIANVAHIKASAQNRFLMTLVQIVHNHDFLVIGNQLGHSMGADIACSSGN